MADPATGLGRHSRRSRLPSVTRILLSPPDVGDLEQQYVLRAIAVRVGRPDRSRPRRLRAGGGRSRRRVPRGGPVLRHGCPSPSPRVVGSRPGDVVPVSTLTFAASVNAIRYVGAEPHFVDCDESGNMNPDLLGVRLANWADRVARFRRSSPWTCWANASDYDAIASIARSIGARLLCDAAESMGATFGGRPPAHSATPPCCPSTATRS